MTEAERSTADRLIGLAAPLLDLILEIGDRVSRIAEPTDHEYYPIRSGSEVAPRATPACTRTSGCCGMGFARRG